MPSVDGLRAFAVSSAVLFHLSFLAGLPSAPDFLRHVQPCAAGLEMFFVLSGVMVTGMLVREYNRSDTISVKMFYVRRSRRLGPGLLLVVPVLLVLQAVLGGGSDGPLGPSWWLTIGAVFLSLGNWRLFFNETGLGWLGPLWTLGIEEQFYVTWPLAIRSVFRRRVRRGWVIGTLTVLLLASTATASVVQAASSWRYTYYLTPTQLQGLLMGCALGYEIATNPRGRLARLLSMQVVPLVGLAGMAAVAGWLDTSPAALARYGYLAFGAGACLVVGHCFVRGDQRSVVTSILGARFLTSCGKLSYEIYLIHMGVILGVRRAAPTMPVIEMMILDVAIIVAVSALLYHFAEAPVRAHGWRRALARIPRPTWPTWLSTRQLPAATVVPVPVVAQRMAAEEIIGAGVTSSRRR